MGWAYGTNPDGKEVGYSVPDVCNQPGCDEAIDRGLSYVCGSMHGGDDFGCGDYFCSAHLFYVRVDKSTTVQLCRACADLYDEKEDEDA
jgi:Uri superfamily endonuclease